MSMYHGDNPTAQKSQQWIAQSVIELMTVKPYSELSIRDICKKADLSRQTFYNLFDSKEEVLRFCLRINYEKLFSEQANAGSITIEAAVRDFANEMKLDAKLLTLMIDNGLESIITDEIARCVELFANHFAGQFGNKKLLPYEEAFVSGALSRVLVHWFKDENRIGIDELNGVIVGICSGKLLESKK